MQFILGYAVIDYVLAGGAASIYEHYIDIDRVHAVRGVRGQPGSGDQAARSQASEGLDHSVLATLRQSQGPHDSGAGEAAVSTEQTTEEIEMTERDQQETVSFWRLPDTSATRHLGPSRGTSTPVPKTWYGTLRRWC